MMIMRKLIHEMISLIRDAVELMIGIKGTDGVGDRLVDGTTCLKRHLHCADF